MAIPANNIKLSVVAAEFNCAVTLTACAAAAGLPSTNIKISDFAGLSAGPTGLSISPNSAYDFASTGQFCIGSFVATVGGNAAGVTYAWSVTSGGAAVYYGQGTANAKIRRSSSFTRVEVGTVKCVISYPGGSMTASASYEFEWENLGGGDINLN